MAISSFPNGFNYGVTINGVPLQQAYPGKVFWVNNSTVLAEGGVAGSDANKGTYRQPFSTIQKAIDSCTAARGDVIMVMPGHAETVSATNFALNKAGVAIVGLGRGSNRPTLTFGAAAATVTVSAANCSVANILHVGGFADTAVCYTLTTAKDFCLESCEFRDASSILNLVKVIDTNTTANAADGLTVVNNRVYSLATTAGTTMINIDGTMDRLTVMDNFYCGAVLNNTAALIEHNAVNATNVQVGRNKIYRPNTDTATGAIVVKTTATVNTGMVHENFVGCLDAAGIILFTSGSDYAPIQNFVTGAVNASGFLLPAADTDA